GEGAPLTPEQMQQLMDQLQAGVDAMNASTTGKPGSSGKAGQAGSGKPGGKLQLPSDPKELEKMLSELKECLECESKKLCEMRGNCQGKCSGYSLEQMLAEGNKPGRGGVTRGPGAASLEYGHETDETGSKF